MADTKRYPKTNKVRTTYDKEKISFHFCSPLPVARDVSAMALAEEDIPSENKAATDFSNLPSPQTALYNLGAGTGRNLLDNWYFADPVNQRGQAGSVQTGS